MSNTAPVIHCQLKTYRQRKGLSQDALARLVGVRRQAIYDMEAGKYLPNTAVALSLARTLGCTVERLFVHESSALADDVTLLAPVTDGQRLALGRVGKTLVGVPLTGQAAMPFTLHRADALWQPQHLDLLRPPHEVEHNVLMLGCDPALALVQEQVQVSGLRAHALFASSRQGLAALARGEAHVASIHYHGSEHDEANVAAVHAALPQRACLIMAFALQEEGLMVAARNPLDIRVAADLAQARIRLVNREEGAALRVLLDAQLARDGIPPCRVTGYNTLVRSHGEGAMHVASGAADAALGLRVVAEAFGLDFVPLATSRSALVIPADFCEHPGVAAMLNTMQSADLRRELNALPGYDAAITGQIIQSPNG